MKGLKRRFFETRRASVASTFIRPYWGLLALTQGKSNEGLLLQFVSLGRACGRGGIGGPLDAAQFVPDNTSQARNHKRKRAHIGRLFLDPYELGSVLVTSESSFQVVCREGIHLLKHDDGGTRHFQLLALHPQLMSNLAAAEKHAPGVERRLVSQHILKARKFEIRSW